MNCVVCGEPIDDAGTVYYTFPDFGGVHADCHKIVVGIKAEMEHEQIRLLIEQARERYERCNAGSSSGL